MHLVLNENYRVVINDFTFILQEKRKQCNKDQNLKLRGKRPLNPIPILIRFRFPTVWQ